MESKELKIILERHKDYLLGKPGGAKANLWGANLDYSCWPLWCGSLGAKVDKRIAVQLAYHFCSLNCDDPEYLTMRNSLIDFANQFHRIDECGKLEWIEVKEEEACK